MGNRNAVHLYTVKPNGTEMGLLYGRNSHASGSDGDTVQFVSPRATDDGRLLALIRPFSRTDYGGDLLLIDAENFVERDRAVDGGGGQGQAAATGLPVRTAEGPSVGGRFASAYPINDGTGRFLVTWSPCRVQSDLGPLPCSEELLADPDVETADPRYGVWIYDGSDATLRPVVLPGDGEMIPEAVSANPRDFPTLADADVSCDPLIPGCVAEQVGLIEIRSVYDMDGSDSAPGGIATVSDPGRTTVADRPARYLRIVKAVAIPDEDVRDIDNAAFGVSRAQLMREIVGYLAIEPDGSVLGKVPAGVPFAISVVDANGRRTSERHRSWLQVQAGERLSCNGCHQRTSPVAHGRADAQPDSVNPGAATDSLPFPNTDPALIAFAGETMAQTRARTTCATDCASLEPMLDLRFVDVWTDPALRPVDPAENVLYAALQTPAPASADCQSNWDSSCRSLIQYETHIQPLWELTRQTLDVDGITVLDDRTCVLCHTTRDANGDERVADAQLDLTDLPSNEVALRLMSYQELLAQDDEEELDENDRLVDRIVQATDGQGNLVFETDENGDPVFETDVNGELVLDANGNPIPVPVLVRVDAVGPAMSANGSAGSTRFFSRFDAGGSHEGDLDAAELRLIAEWLDIGAQYFNNPFDAPED